MGDGFRFVSMSSAHGRIHIANQTSTEKTLVVFFFVHADSLGERGAISLSDNCQEINGCGR